MEEEVSVDKVGGLQNVLISEVNVGGPSTRTRNKTKVHTGVPAKDMFEVMDDYQKTVASDMEAANILKNM